MLTKANTECRVDVHLSKRSSILVFILIRHFIWRFENMAILNIGVSRVLIVNENLKLKIKGLVQHAI
jgi:hypothetical protein